MTGATEKMISFFNSSIVNSVMRELYGSETIKLCLNVDVIRAMFWVVCACMNCVDAFPGVCDLYD